jgi:hypothetical protein
MYARFANLLFPKKNPVVDEVFHTANLHHGNGMLAIDRLDHCEPTGSDEIINVVTVVYVKEPTFTIDVVVGG